MSKFDKRFEEVNTLLEDRLGPVENWSDEVDQFLADASVNRKAARRSLYECVSEIAGSYRARNQEIPIPIVEFLRQIRPSDLSTSDPVEFDESR
jgi:hypothetical protein